MRAGGAAGAASDQQSDLRALNAAVTGAQLEATLRRGSLAVARAESALSQALRGPSSTAQVTTSFQHLSLKILQCTSVLWCRLGCAALGWASAAWLIHHMPQDLLSCRTVAGRAGNAGAQCEILLAEHVICARAPVLKSQLGQLLLPCCLHAAQQKPSALSSPHCIFASQKELRLHTIWYVCTGGNRCVHMCRQR